MPARTGPDRSGGAIDPDHVSVGDGALTSRAIVPGGGRPAVADGSRPPAPARPAGPAFPAPGKVVERPFATVLRFISLARVAE